MVREDDRTFHTSRARAEQELADHAERPSVADAHRRLSSLHIERLRSMEGEDSAADD